MRAPWGGVGLALLMLAGAAPACADSGPGRKPVRFAVQFETEDGFTLHGDLTSAADVNAPVAILLHMYRSNRRAFDPLVPALVEAGLTVLALDQRAHGESTRQDGRTLRVDDLSRERFAELVRTGPRDVAAARRYLAERGFATDRIFLVGASYGCTVALLAARRLEGVGGLVLLSPGTAYFDVDVTDVAAGAGPLLAVAAEDDPSSAESARRLVETHAGPEELLVFPSGGHGTNLFGSRPELPQRIVAFVRKALAAGGPPAGSATP